ncbi:MAG TPA: hypothetical protein VN043_10085 [Rhodanobacter sp.]|nr:hypothetical protein [Rhodanobacter sp.]
MHANTFTRFSALAPLVMSLVALALVIGRIAVVGTARQVDEGTVAHLFQLLIVCQVPIVAFFAIKWLRRIPKQALAVLALQALAAAVACAPVAYLNL